MRINDTNETIQRCILYTTSQPKIPRYDFLLISPALSSIRLRKQSPHLFRLLFLRATLYENYYNKCLLLLFFVVFSASLSGSDGFVLSDSLDVNNANV